MFDEKDKNYNSLNDDFIGDSIDPLQNDQTSN
jgi:hypothetical protein